jgi:hypothetical protein
MITSSQKIVLRFITMGVWLKFSMGVWLKLLNFYLGICYGYTVFSGHHPL